MANTRFLITNYLKTAILKNGTGGAPARDEVSPYVIEQAVNSDRFSVWRASSAGCRVDFDLTGAASNVSTQVGAVLGIKGGLSSVAFSLDPTGSYPPPYTVVSTPTVNGARNVISIAGSPINARFASFLFATSGSAFEVGRLVVGQIDSDIGIISSPGYDKTTQVPAQEYRTFAGVPVTNYGIGPYKTFSIPFGSITATTNAKLDALATLKQSVILIDHNDVAYECRVMQYNFVQIVAAVPLFNGVLELVELP